MPSVKLVGVYDASPDAATSTAADYGCPAAGSLDELLGRAKAVTIAVPTRHHADVADACLRRGVAAWSRSRWRKTSPTAGGSPTPPPRRRHRAGRPHRALQPRRPRHGRLEMAPRFIEVIRISPMTFRSIDVGVVLDMMITTLTSC